MTVHILDVQDFLPLGQGEVHRPTAHNLNQWLPITQFARTQLVVRAISHFYSPAQVVSLQRSIRNLSITDYFIMYQSGNRNAASPSIIDIFFMWHAVKIVEYEQLVHLLNLVQTVTVFNAKAARNTFVMTQTATYTSVRPRTLTKTFQPVSRASVWMADKYSYSITLPTLTGPNAPEC